MERRHKSRYNSWHGQSPYSMLLHGDTGKRIKTSRMHTLCAVRTQILSTDLTVKILSLRMCMSSPVTCVSLTPTAWTAVNSKHCHTKLPGRQERKFAGVLVYNFAFWV
jgi:hypothetical protein